MGSQIPPHATAFHPRLAEPRLGGSGAEAPSPGPREPRPPRTAAATVQVQSSCAIVSALSRSLGSRRASPSLCPARPLHTPTSDPKCRQPKSPGAGRLWRRWRCSLHRRGEGGQDPPPCSPHTHRPEAAAAAEPGAALGARKPAPGTAVRRRRRRGRLPAGEIHGPSRPGQGQMKHLPRLRRPFAGWALSAPRGRPARRPADTRGGRSRGATRRAGTRALAGPPLLSPPPPGLLLTAPAALKATEPHFPVADFCPEPRRCRLRAGSLTSGAGRQRAATASAVPGGLGSREVPARAGGPDLHLGCPRATPWDASCVLWVLLLLLALLRRKGV